MTDAAPPAGTLLDPDVQMQLIAATEACTCRGCTPTPTVRPEDHPR